MQDVAHEVINWKFNRVEHVRLNRRLNIATVSSAQLLAGVLTVATATSVSALFTSTASASRSNLLLSLLIHKHIRRLEYFPSMVVTTRQSQDHSQPKPSFRVKTQPVLVSTQTKANEKQLQYLLAVYDSLGDAGQVASASSATGL